MPGLRYCVIQSAENCVKVQSSPFPSSCGSVVHILDRLLARLLPKPRHYRESFAGGYGLDLVGGFGAKGDEGAGR